MSNDIRSESQKSDALAAADEALDHLYAAQEQLNKARNWGFYDMLGGGMFGSMIKHSKMQKANQEIQAAKEAVARFMRTVEGIDGGVLYNRCHLIAWSLAAENDNERNLITGTRYLNVEGMLPFETQILEYIEQTGNHVLYRVTPLFEGDELVARGVQLEAWSVEDDGAGICFNVYCYNVQPRVEIDYATGESEATA